jgi:NAD(P)H-flavin reductase
MMKTCKVNLNGETFFAKCGDLLLDSVLINGLSIPHDCRSGICGTCRVRLTKGSVFGGHESGDDMVHACKARVVSDLEIVTEPTPEPKRLSAKVVRLETLSPEIVGLSVAPTKPFHYLPGQYYKLQFGGYPERCYSPTVPLEGGFEDHLLHFHIRKFAQGAVSSALGNDIVVGHRVRLSGPFGDAYLRPGHRGRIILVGSGTGFAPIWSVAVAAVLEQPERELVVLAAARSLQSLYMHRALCRLARFPNVTIIPIVAEPQNLSHAVRVGTPIDFLPEVRSDDVVYAAGAPSLTGRVAEAVKHAGARCYVDSFVPALQLKPRIGLIDRAGDWLFSDNKIATARS